MSEGPLGLGRTGRENMASPRSRILGAGKPECRLPDARVALEHECRGPVLYLINERPDGGELRLPADDVERARAARPYVTTILPCIHECNPHMK